MSIKFTNYFTEPSPDISATLIHEFLKLAGFKLSQFYGLQFWKLIHLLYTEYYPRIDKVRVEGVSFREFSF